MNLNTVSTAPTCSARAPQAPSSSVARAAGSKARPRGKYFTLGLIMALRKRVARPNSGTPRKGRPAPRVSSPSREAREGEGAKRLRGCFHPPHGGEDAPELPRPGPPAPDTGRLGSAARSEEHTSELQSQSNLV